MDNYPSHRVAASNSGLPVSYILYYLFLILCFVYFAKITLLNEKLESSSKKFICHKKVNNIMHRQKTYNYIDLMTSYKFGTIFVVIICEQSINN